MFSIKLHRKLPCERKAFIDWSQDAAAGERDGDGDRDGRNSEKITFVFSFLTEAFCQSEALHLILGKREIARRNPECRFHTNPL